MLPEQKIQSTERSLLCTWCMKTWCVPYHADFSRWLWQRLQSSRQRTAKAANSRRQPPHSSLCSRDAKYLASALRAWSQTSSIVRRIHRGELPTTKYKQRTSAFSIWHYCVELSCTDSLLHPEGRTARIQQGRATSSSRYVHRLPRQGTRHS